jgi:hypothetical protein
LKGKRQEEKIGQELQESVDFWTKTAGRNWDHISDTEK